MLGRGAVARGQGVVVVRSTSYVRGHCWLKVCSPSTARPAATLHGQVEMEGQGLGRVSQRRFCGCLGKGSPKWWQGTLPGEVDRGTWPMGTGCVCSSELQPPMVWDRGLGK